MLLNSILTTTKNNDRYFGFILEYFKKKPRDYLRLTYNKKYIIDQEIIYYIAKDIYTNTWLLTCKNIMIFYLNNLQLDELRMNFTQDNNMSFDIYINHICHNNINNDYNMVICTSHLTNLDIQIECDIKYNMLSNIIGSFIILNTKKDCIKELKYIETIGQGVAKKVVINAIKCFLQHFKNSKTLPSHYMCLD